MSQIAARCSACRGVSRVGACRSCGTLSGLSAGASGWKCAHCSASVPCESETFTPHELLADGVPDGGQFLCQRCRAADAPPTGMSVSVRGARFVATWRWNIADADDVCGICRLPFESCCPACKLPGDECPPLLGECKHAFHLHCIVAWLNTKQHEQVCPLCRRPWDHAAE